MSQNPSDDEELYLIAASEEEEQEYEKYELGMYEETEEELQRVRNETLKMDKVKCWELGKEAQEAMRTRTAEIYFRASAEK